MIREDRKGFQILNGFRQTPLDSPPAHVNGQPRVTLNDVSSPSDFFAHQLEGLDCALKAMETRVSSLLEDRCRIGRDLHDCVLQSLYAIGLNLEVAWNPIPHHSTESKPQHDHLVAQLNQLIHEVRVMIESLEEGTIRDFDMAEELVSLQAAYEQGGRLDIRLDLDLSALDNFTAEEQREILNIVREALSNCARHADATHVTVAIRRRGSRIRISIADNGRGFALNDSCRKGYGLTNMDTRARKLGGKLRVKPTSGQGTTIIVDFSLTPILAEI